MSVSEIHSKAKASAEKERGEISFGIRLFGRHLEFRSDIPVSLESIGGLFPPNSVICEPEGATDIFRLSAAEGVRKKGFYWNDELLSEIHEHHLADLSILDCKVQYALSLILSGDFVLLHAGAVSWNGAGIIFPGRTRSGKTSLSEAFLRAGAKYLTDDCTVVDTKLYIHPYPTPLRMRISPEGEERSLLLPSHFGSGTVSGPSEVRYILFTSYEEKANWEPEEIGDGGSVWEILPLLFYTPSIREHPEATLEILGRMAANATVLKSARGDADEVVADIIARLERSDRQP